jgi:hypothetical protein
MPILRSCDRVTWVAPLDKLFGDLRSLDIIKMDIEGMEYKAVMGAKVLINRTRPIIFIEYSPRLQKIGSGIDGRELLLELLKRNYFAEILHRGGTIERIENYEPEAAADLIHTAWQHYVAQEGGSHLDLCFRPN